jgi:hypothetical protein
MVMAAKLLPMEWTVKLARMSMRLTIRARVTAKMYWKNQTMEVCVLTCMRASTSSQSSVTSCICRSAKLYNSLVPPHRLLLHHLLRCCFFHFNIRSDNGNPMLPALCSMLAVHPPHPTAPAGCTPTVDADANSWILFRNLASPTPMSSKPRIEKPETGQFSKSIKTGR